MVLHHGKIAEMKTGEGKTLVATLPCYLNALGGQGVHVVTGQRLPRQTRFRMDGPHLQGPGHEGRRHRPRPRRPGAQGRLQLRHHLRHQQRIRLRLPARQHEVPHRRLPSSDPSTTPSSTKSIPSSSTRPAPRSSFPAPARNPPTSTTASTVSSPSWSAGEVIEGKEPGEKYTTGDYTIDEKHKSAALTEEGVYKVEKLLGVGNPLRPRQHRVNHHVQQGPARPRHLPARPRLPGERTATKAPKVIIVDESPGRNHARRRWSDGLHQAVEAKENVKNPARRTRPSPPSPSRTISACTKKLAGMTGTAETKRPNSRRSTTRRHRHSHQPCHDPQGKSGNGYRTEVEKFRNAAKEIMELNKARPARCWWPPSRSRNPRGSPPF